MLKAFIRTARRLGIDATKFTNLREVPSYLSDRRRFLSSMSDSFAKGEDYPALGDRDSNSGTASGHYFHQDLLVASLINEREPERHVDVGSRIDGFVSHVASFREIEVIDIRPLRPAHNITFTQRDILKCNPEFDSYCDSLSCLHTLEHFGLGRYGGKIDCNGHLRGLHNLTQMLEEGGTFYLSVPIGQLQRVEFNAHRVFSIPYLLNILDEKLHLREFSYIDDHGDLHRDVSIGGEEAERTFGLDYGCGILDLVKA